MLIKGYQINLPMVTNLFVSLVLIICLFTSSVNGVEPRKLDETLLPATNGTEVKCGPCGTNYPPPPPPALPPPSPPPPSPKKPSTQYCPPPPPSSFIYITGPPGNLYPVDENFNGAFSHRGGVLFPFFVALVISTLVFW